MEIERMYIFGQHRPVHRDIKPSNVLLAADGEARLFDFGLAQLPGASGRSVGSAGLQPGTPLYMAPEQEESRRSLTPSADLYAGGCILFKMLTGKRYKRVRPGTKASTLRPDAPIWLDAVLAKALAEDQWERYQDAAEMGSALRAGQEWEEQRKSCSQETRERAEEKRQQEQAVVPQPRPAGMKAGTKWYVLAIGGVSTIVVALLITGWAAGWFGGQAMRTPIPAAGGVVLPVLEPTETQTLTSAPTWTLEPTETQTPTSAEPPAPIVTEPPVPGEAAVVIRAVTGVGDLATEGMMIANEGSRHIQLSNWRVEDSQGNVYTFKPFILFGDGANVVLHTGPGTDTMLGVYWGLAFAVWEPGETATLRDPDGMARATLTVASPR